MTACPLVRDRIVRFLVLNSGMGTAEASDLASKGEVSYSDGLLVHIYSQLDKSVRRDTYEFCKIGVVMIRSEYKSEDSIQWIPISPR